MKLRSAPILFVILLAIAPGCSKQKAAVPKDLSPVEGVVRMDKVPLAGVTVTFCPEVEGSPSAAGVTDPNGRFQLTSFPSGNGAQPGKYKVIVVARATGGYSPKAVGPSATSTKAIPPQYGIPAQTPLAATVPAAGEIVLELKSKLQ